jgi:hypothetical protein
VFFALSGTTVEVLAIVAKSEKSQKRWRRGLPMKRISLKSWDHSAWDQ